MLITPRPGLRSCPNHRMGSWRLTVRTSKDTRNCFHTAGDNPEVQETNLGDHYQHKETETEYNSTEQKGIE